MARYSAAYSDLTVRLDEVGRITKAAKGNEAKKPLGSQTHLVSALCRGGIVLLSSHIEGYIADLNELILEQLVKKKVSIKKLSPGFCYYHSRDILNEISETSEPEKISKKLKLLHSRDSFVWDDEDIFLKPLDDERFMKGFSTPKPEYIYSLFRRYGCSNLKGDIAKSLARQFYFHQNNVETTVHLRNQIAHGDHSITQTPEDLKRLTESTKIFCREIDNSVCRWFSNIKCSLR